MGQHVLDTLLPHVAMVMGGISVPSGCRPVEGCGLQVALVRCRMREPLSDEVVSTLPRFRLRISFPCGNRPPSAPTGRHFQRSLVERFSLVTGGLNGKGAAPGSSVVATPLDPCCPHGLTERYVICTSPAICNRASMQEHSRRCKQATAGRDLRDAGQHCGNVNQDTGSGGLERIPF
jgi:hypothetical protein